MTTDSAAIEPYVSKIQTRPIKRKKISKYLFTKIKKGNMVDTLKWVGIHNESHEKDNPVLVIENFGDEKVIIVL